MSAAPVIGCRVVVSGLQTRPELNGCRGLVVARNQQRDRWGVRIDGERDAVMLMASKLEVQTQNAWGCTLWLQLEAMSFVSLRFLVGDRVECKCEGGWQIGAVEELFSRTHNPAGYCAAYSIRLDSNARIYVPLDTDMFIR
eukprot:2506852-Prymnesium_polylepis.1